MPEASTGTLSAETRDKLRKVATPTLMTALYRRGLRNQWIQDVHLINPEAAPMVGTAFTLRYIPAREDLNKLDVFRDRNHPQRQAIEQCPPGAVLVIDSRKDARAASAGSILISRLMVRGCAGVVTDGGFRDTPELRKLPFSAYHHRPAAPTNLTLHQAIEINGPIGCGDEIANETLEMTAFEDFVTEEVLKGRSILGLYPATEEQTLKDFEAWRKANNR